MFETIRRNPSAASLTTLALAWLVSAVSSSAQATTPDPDPLGWNTPRSLELMRAGRDKRQETSVDPDFRSYSAQARGFVYFYIDREDQPENTLIKTDQIALEIYWASPNRTKQRIIGLRDEKQLPTNIRYHLDHLTVVQNEFGDRIRMGDGDEVSSVLHPLAPGSEETYDFRLADSITVTLPGPTEPVRVYELQVRPRYAQQPGFVGSVFLDRATSAVVRMNFTFTPASYVDPYLDYIRISLDNGLWEGRYWLPYRQWAELRREIPELDMPVGTVIRGRYEIGDYELNPDLPPGLFDGRPVTAVPEQARRAFPFEEDIHAQIDEEGLGPAPEMEEIRRQASEIARGQLLSGLRPTRVYLPSVSSTLRYNRAEGAALGAGVSFVLAEESSLRTHAGWSFGRQKPTLDAELRHGSSDSQTTLQGFLNRGQDIGPAQGVSGVFNSLSSLALGQDYLDLFFSSGAELSHRLELGDNGTLLMAVGWERHRSGNNVVDDDPLGDGALGPVRPAEESDFWSTSLQAEYRFDMGLELALKGSSALRGGLGFGSVALDARWSREWLGRGSGLHARLRSGLLTPGAPPQALYLLGGRSSLPGFPYREFVGDRYWMADLLATRTLVHPFVSGRALFSAGQSDLHYATLPPGWQDLEATQLRASAGVGLAFGWNVLRVDLVRGLGSGGEWQLLLSVDPRFWPWL